MDKKNNVLVIDGENHYLDNNELIIYFANYFTRFPFDNRFNSYISNALKNSHPVKSDLIKNNLIAPTFGLDFYRNFVKNRINIKDLINEDSINVIKFKPPIIDHRSFSSLSFNFTKFPIYHNPINNLTHTIAILKNASCFINNTGYSIFNSKMQYIDGICNSDGILFANSDFSKFINPLHLNGKSLILCSAWSNGYFHW